MEFIESNFLNTTTQIVVNSATDRAQYLFDRDIRFQYVSSGLNDDNTFATIKINFAETVSVSRIALVEHNLKVFNLYYNGVTANAFAFTTTGSTNSSSFITNSTTSQYFRATPVNCTSVSLDMKSTIVANAEKAVGFFVLSALKLDFERDPAAKGYTPKLDPTEVVHTLSDGGTRVQNVADKFKVTINYSYLSLSNRDSLKTIWAEHDEFMFCPFGTTTAWDQILFPCVWPGDFEFYKFSDNAPNTGFTGKINLMETPR